MTRDRDVVVVGAGVAGCAAGLFTARAGLDTLLLSGGDSIVSRSVRLENYLGFPDGVGPAAFVERCRDHVRTAGCRVQQGTVVDVGRADDGFRVRTETAGTVTAGRVVAASWPDATYLDGLGVPAEHEDGKSFVEADADCRTAVDGVYVAGRLTGDRHQALVAAGSGATAGLSAVEDARPEHYADWVAPTGYFTNAGYDVPPGVEERTPSGDR